MSLRLLLIKLLAIVAIIALALLVYGGVVRPWLSRWGATDAEVERVMLGDELLAYADFDATRAVTINASPEDIWPWLVQWGFGKAGFYGYDLIEGIGSPSGLRSADRIVPELQTLNVRDKVKMNDLAYLVVRAIAPNRSLILTSDDKPPISVMTWQLDPIDAGHTRLVNRYRFIQLWDSPMLFLTGLTEFGDTVAIRKILLGIKDRAEGRVEPLAYQGVEIVLWLSSIISFGVAVVLIFRRRVWWRAWLIGLLTALVFLFVFFAYQSLWIGVLLQMVLVLGLGWAYQTPTSTLAGRSMTVVTESST